MRAPAMPRGSEWAPPAVTFLGIRNLAQSVVDHGIKEEGITCAGVDRDEPRQDENDKPEHTVKRAKSLKPAYGAIDDRECRHGEANDQDNHEPLYQNSSRECGPKYRKQSPSGSRDLVVARE